MNEAREKWVHEDDLINHRLTWLGVTQGLLFTALGFAFHEKLSPPTVPMPREQIALLDTLIKGLPYLGLITSILILFGVLGATTAMVLIKREFQLPVYGVSLFTTLLGWVCAIGIPVIFVVAWVVVIRATSA